MSEEVLEHDHHPHYHEPGILGFIKRWVFTTNHKDIGTLYLWFSCFMFFLGGTMALLIRAELFKPGLQLVTPDFFNTMTTMHGLIMIFGVVMPAFVGLANWQIPLMIGAPDMALPRLNNWSFWILPFAFTSCCQHFLWRAQHPILAGLFMRLFQPPMGHPAPII